MTIANSTPRPWFARQAANGSITIEHESDDLRSVIATLHDNQLCAEHGNMQSNALLKRKIACAQSLLLPLGSQITPSVLAIREAIHVLR